MEQKEWKDKDWEKGRVNGQRKRKERHEEMEG